MYDELIKMLRTCAERDSCIGWKEACTYLGTGVCDNKAEKAADAIEELICEVADEHNARLDAEERQRWIPVTERLPKYGERVLVFGGVTLYVAYYDKNRYGGESWHKLNSKSHYCNPTHWLPLPEPPKEDT